MGTVEEDWQPYIQSWTDLAPAPQDETKLNRDKGALLWRVFRRQPETRSGALRADRERFIDAVTQHPELYLVSDESEFRRSFKGLLTPSAGAPVNLETVALRIFIQFQKELGYLEGRQDQQFTFDLLFQTVEIFGLDAGAGGSAEEALRRIGASQGLFPNLDRERLVEYYRAYSDIGARIHAAGAVEKAVEKRERIVEAASSAFPRLPLTAIDSMFRYYIAQIVLARLYRCGELIELWREEYGFGEAEGNRMRQYVPDSAALTEFRGRYVEAIRRLERESADGSRDAAHSLQDGMLLRTLANYFTSWVMSVSEKMPRG